MSKIQAGIARSADGTQIAYEARGDGPPIVFVDGAFCSRAMGPGKQLSPVLSEHHTAVIYDRRGRGQSGDGERPYDPRREIEDLAAVVSAVGGEAHLFGHSSGAVLALEAAQAGVPVSRLAVYEPPLVVDTTRPPVPADLPARLTALAGQGRAGAVIRTFVAEAVAAPAVMGLVMSIMPGSGKLKQLAGTVAYDAALVNCFQGGHPLTEAPWGSVTAPTLVIAGAKSPAWMRNAAVATTAALPHAELRVLPGQRHMVKPKSTAPELARFFAAPVLRSGASRPSA
jgi:pimeloyl-ACP methyl ester carboxylesterase